MNSRPNGLQAAAGALPKRAPEPDLAAEAQSEVDDGDKRQTLYLPHGVHEQLREAAFAKRISMQEVIRRGLDLWFAQEGLPAWEEAKRRKR